MRNVTYTIITYYGRSDLVVGWKWEIKTDSALITSRRKIQTKNDCFISLNHHFQKFFGANVNRGKVKNREVKLYDV